MYSIFAYYLILDYYFSKIINLHWNVGCDREERSELRVSQIYFVYWYVDTAVGLDIKCKMELQHFL